MSDIDKDLLRAALSAHSQPCIPDAIKAGFKEIGRAPLAALIDEYLNKHAGVRNATALGKIAGLNQGRVADLDDPLFRSYIVSHTRLSDKEILACSKILRTYMLVQEAPSGRNLRVAARSDQNETMKPVSADDIARELRKRR